MSVWHIHSGDAAINTSGKTPVLIQLIFEGGDGGRELGGTETKNENKHIKVNVISDNDTQMSMTYQ